MHAYVAGERVTLLRPRGAGQKQTRQSREARDQTVPEIPGAFHRSHNNCEEVTSTNAMRESDIKLARVNHSDSTAEMGVATESFIIFHLSFFIWPFLKTP